MNDVDVGNLFIRVPPQEARVFPGDCAICFRDTHVRGTLDRMQYYGEEGDEVAILECGHPLHERCLRSIFRAAQEAIMVGPPNCPSCSTLLDENLLPPALSASRPLPLRLGMIEAYENGYVSSPQSFRRVTSISFHLTTGACAFYGAGAVLIYGSAILSREIYGFGVRSYNEGDHADMAGRVSQWVNQSAVPEGINEDHIITGLFFTIVISRVAMFYYSFDIKRIAQLGHNGADSRPGALATMGLCALLQSGCYLGVHNIPISEYIFGDDKFAVVCVYFLEAVVASVFISRAITDFCCPDLPPRVNRDVVVNIGAYLIPCLILWGTTPVTDPYASFHIPIGLCAFGAVATPAMLVFTIGDMTLATVHAANSYLTNVIGGMAQRLGTRRICRQFIGSAYAMREGVHQIAYRVHRTIRRRLT